MRANTITSCYLGPAISPEQFISQHFFLYLVKGTITGYDAHKKYVLNAGEYCIVRKNHLARYSKQKQDGEFEKVVVAFDEVFLNQFLIKHTQAVNPAAHNGAFVLLQNTPLVPNFIQSLLPYYNNDGRLDNTFVDIKREELLLVLLKTNPGLAGILFDFGIPAKIDIKAFMQQHYKFNVGIQRFAYLTGRNLSAFKRDFKKTFNDTPSHWLIQRRLHEGYFLLEKQGKKPSDIYIELGFEDLSHFSYAFKQSFGVTPASLVKK